MRNPCIFHRFRNLAVGSLPHLVKQTACRGNDRHAEQNAGNSEQRTAHEHGEQNPNARNANAAANDARIDEVTLDLLKDHQEQHENKRLLERDRQDHQRANDTANPCTHKGNEGTQANQNADGHGIGNAHN